MPNQSTLPLPRLDEAMKKKATKREIFLAEMDAVVPWSRLVSVIEPHYPKAGLRGGRPPISLETMLRVYFLQNWYNLSDPGVEDALLDIEPMRTFAGIEFGIHRIPDETTILKFRRLLEKHDLTDKLFEEVNQLLEENGYTVGAGTVVDATIIHAPTSTKNESKARDPEMSSTKKANDRHFGMKAHVGADVQTGLVHSYEATTAKVPDVQVWDELLHGEEKSVWADKGYVSEERRKKFLRRGRSWCVMRKAPSGGKLSDVDKRFNWRISRVRGKVEHPFRVVKRQFGYTKVRYRGIAKNRAQQFTLFALSNLYTVRQELAA